MNNFQHNNLKAKAKLILKAFENEMSQDDKLLFIYFEESDYISNEDRELFKMNEFRYRAYQTGLI